MTQGSRQIQSQVQQQLQTLSPQQILVVKLLELPALELEDRIHAELLENPALEEGQEDGAADELPETPGGDDSSDPAEYDANDDYRTEDDIPDYKLQDNNRSRKAAVDEIPFSEAASFYELLKSQLNELNLSESRREVTDYLICSLDDDGLLRKPLGDISDELAIYAGIEVDEEELEEALKIIRDFDPPGLGARNLQECLLNQILRKEDTPLRKIEIDIMEQCYEEFTRKHWDKIKMKLGLTTEEFEAALADITKLNPRPGSSMGESIGRNMQQIVPDFIVETMDDDTIVISLNNRNVPELRMSRGFADMLKEQSANKAGQSKETRNAVLFLKQKIEAAQNFINAVRRRQHVLMTTMQAIVDLQRPFFLEGDEILLRPMILKDVAERTGLDISTISRVSNSKYAQTNYGIYALKYFFSDAIVTDDGEELSVREIKSVLRDFVGNEDKKCPLTDEELADMLKEKGFPVARRTVAKYRRQLNIPVARLRK
ncbi:MAG: RNA polymerase factor sigma-54 [Mediterranea sp.]|nr:RNA polymerase factor sigma-54 [Mediterranea sp.]